MRLFSKYLGLLSLLLLSTLQPLFAGASYLPKELEKVLRVFFPVQQEDASSEEKSLSFADLPPEAKAYIFSKLSPKDLTAARLTCRDWNAVIGEYNKPQFYKNLDLRNPRLLKRLIKDGHPFLSGVKVLYGPKALALGDTQVANAILRIIASSFLNLQTLNLAGCTQITNATIIELARARKLQTLNLSHCGITSAGIIALARSAPTLQFLDLSWCIELTDAAIIALAQKAPNLQTLNLRHSYQFSLEAIEALQQAKPNLKIIR